MKVKEMIEIINELASIKDNIDGCCVTVRTIGEMTCEAGESITGTDPCYEYGTWCTDEFNVPLAGRYVAQVMENFTYNSFAIRNSARLINHAFNEAVDAITAMEECGYKFIDGDETVEEFINRQDVEDIVSLPYTNCNLWAKEDGTFDLNELAKLTANVYRACYALSKPYYGDSSLYDGDITKEKIINSFKEENELLMLVHDSVLDQYQTYESLCNADLECLCSGLGVDSGQIGFIKTSFMFEHHKNDPKFDDLYEKYCETTTNGGGVLYNACVVNQTTFGDGSYPLYSIDYGNVFVIDTNCIFDIEREG